MKRTLWLSITAALLVALAFAGTGCTGPTGIVSGTVVSATTGLPVSGVSVACGRATTLSDDSGDFSLEVPVGNQTVRFTKTGFCDFSLPVAVQKGETSEVDTLPISTALASGQYRIVLSWGELPYDLDSHLWTPGGYEVYFGDEGADNSSPFVWLDIDDTESYGPETITITQSTTGTYTYSVHNFSADFGFDEPLTASHARVEVYNVNGLMRSFTVPTSGTGNWWNVFTMSNGAITPVNTITETPPLESAVYTWLGRAGKRGR